MNLKLFLTSEICIYVAIPAREHYTIKKMVWRFLEKLKVELPDDPAYKHTHISTMEYYSTIKRN